MGERERERGEERKKEKERNLKSIIEGERGRIKMEYTKSRLTFIFACKISAVPLILQCVGVMMDGPAPFLSSRLRDRWIDGLC